MNNQPPKNTLERFNVKVTGQGERTIVFSHGFGCDQNMWRLVVPLFEPDFRVVLFDLAGSGAMGSENYSKSKYASLNPYAADVIQIASDLGLKDMIFVGHSVSAMIGVLAAELKPSLFSQLVLVGPSPRYVNDGEYIGGFDKLDIEELLDSLSNNYLGWSSQMAPVIMGNSERPELSEER